MVAYALFELFLGENFDFQIDNDTTFIITPEVSRVCLLFRTIDDLIPENPEEVTVTIEMSGQTVGSTTIVITDTDGMCVGVGVGVWEWCGCGRGCWGVGLGGHEPASMNNPFIDLFVENLIADARPHKRNILLKHSLLLCRLYCCYDKVFL